MANAIPNPVLTLDASLNTAAGSTTARTLAARAAHVANILDYGGGIGGDDALAMRLAIASGKKLIYVPPGTYTNRSVIHGPAHAAGPCAWLMSGLTDTFIYAYGATFLMDSAVQVGDVGTAFCQIAANCKNVGMLGGTMVGNKTFLSASRENSAFLIAGVTGLLLRDIKITGEFLTFMGAVFAFDSLIENIHGYNLAQPVDISSLENVTFSKCFFSANPTNPVTGVNCHYDTHTLLDGTNITNEDGTPRTLRFNNTNGLVISDCHFDGYYTGIAIDSCRGARISKTTVRGIRRPDNTSNSSGILLDQGSAAITAGYPTTDVVVENCEISGHGVTNTGGTGAGYGVNLAAGPNGTISQVRITNSRIYDNDATGIGSSSLGNTTAVTLAGNDFASRAGLTVQTTNISAAVTAVLTSDSGSFSALSVTGVTSFMTGSVTPQAAVFLEGLSQSGVADADGKAAVIRVTGNQNTGGDGGSVEFGARRTTSGGGAVGSGYFASLKGALLSGVNNTTGNLEVYVRAVNSDAALTLVGVITSTGLNNMAVGATTPAAVTATQLNVTTTAGPNVRSGTGAASGTQPKGSIWLRTDGGVGTTLYVSQGGGTWNAVAAV